MTSVVTFVHLKIIKILTIRDGRESFSGGGHEDGETKSAAAWVGWSRVDRWPSIDESNPVTS